MGRRGPTVRVNFMTKPDSGTQLSRSAVWFWRILLIVNLPHLLLVWFERIRSYASPHFWVLFGGVAVLVVMTLGRRQTTTSVAIALILLLATPLTAFFAMRRWPGGDDGGGMAWFIVACGTSLLNATAVLIFLAVWSAQRRRRPTLPMDRSAG